MGFFSIFRNKKNSSDIELIPLEVITGKEEFPDYSNEDILPISVNGVVDTTSKDNELRYKHNVELLRNRCKITGNPGDMVVIRNDDILPDNYVWRENSNNTYGELAPSLITPFVRNYILQSKFAKKSPTGFLIPGFENTEEYKEEQKKFSKDFAKIMLPTKFRTTKHFTINTPLGYTGSYNNVSSDRKYTIIDDADSLIKSPYTYTISGWDSYLDVTHEGFPISKNAIVLISEDYFNEIKDNKELMAKLNERHLMVYKGDINVAINMIISENGMLPYRPGLHIHYDSEVENIIETKFREICATYGYEYAIGHGNLFGSGGHFTDLIDTDYSNSHDMYEPFISFINLNCDVEFNSDIIRDTTLFTKFIDTIGIDRFLELIESYNKYMTSYFDSKRKEYTSMQDSIPKETLEIFRTTVKTINSFYKDVNPYSDKLLFEMVVKFYTESDVNIQVELANKINEYISSYGRNSYASNSR